MLRRTVGFIIVVTLLILIGYWIYVAVEKRLQEEKKPQMPATVVDAATAQQAEWYDQIKATGTMSAFQGIMMKSEVSGRVTNIYFQDGTYIEKGKPVIQIYPDILQAQLESNKAALRLAQLDYERGVELYKKRVISRQQLDTLTATLRQDEAQVAETQAKLVQHNIDAPFAGMLGLRLVDVGSQVTANQNIVQLQQIDPIRVQFTVPEVVLNKLALGQTVSVTPSNSKKAHQGVVYAFDSGVDPKNRSLGVRARVPNENRELVPGTFVEVTLFGGTKHTVITVPQTAINYSTQGLYVFLITNNKAVETPVTVGVRNADKIEVKSGLKLGDIVVAAGQIKLINEGSVKVRSLDGKPIKPKAAPPKTIPTSNKAPALN